MKNSGKIILGIDPGTLFMGHCIIHVKGSVLSMQNMDVLKLHPRQNNYTRLQVIYRKVEELIVTYRPDCFAIEAPFFGKNVQSMLKLGRAQGVAIAAAISSGLEVCEYSPRKIKQSITGNGNAGKEQVWRMLQQIMRLPDDPLVRYDASDALAVAVCHHFQENTLLTASSRAGETTPSKAKNWKTFMAMHPDRVR